jgi:hypothetical protein
MPNEIKAGFNQVFSRTNNQTQTPYTLSVSGFTSVSAAQTRQEDDTSASLIDNFSMNIGASLHSHAWVCTVAGVLKDNVPVAELPGLVKTRRPSQSAARPALHLMDIP